MSISKAEKAAYNDEIKDIKKEVEISEKKINELTVKKRKIPNIEAYYNLEISSILMTIIELYLKMSDLSMDMLGIKNERFLNEARKAFYKILQMTEEIVGNEVDRSLKENDDYIIKFDKFNPHQILSYVKRINRVFSLLKSRVGEGSKWKWSFVELQARAIVITKNIASFSDVAKYRDPRVEFYYDRQELMQLCKEGLAEAAKQYRTKYELSGRAREDLKKSIDFLSSLRKIHVIFGESEEATKLKNTIDAAKQTLDAEDKSKDKKKKKK